MHRFLWNGQEMVPLTKDAARAFEPGRHYWLEEVSERSWVSHRHEFAFVREAWMNLPEALAEKFPTPEHLRKAALIATGWHREHLIDAGSKAAALRVAAFIRGRDEFLHVIVNGPMVVIRQARSQRMHGHDRMTKAEFQQSKDAVLGWVSELIGVSPDQLKGAA